MARNLRAPFEGVCVVCRRPFQARQEGAVACRRPAHSVAASAIRRLVVEESAALGGRLRDADVNRLLGGLQKWFRAVRRQSNGGAT